jgi:hypothetical protein
MNTFQLGIMQKLLEYASPVDVGDVTISIIKGPEEVVVEMKLVARSVSFWVYEDEAQILGPKIDIRYEVPDFRDPVKLASTFLNKAKDYLAV